MQRLSFESNSESEDFNAHSSRLNETVQFRILSPQTPALLQAPEWSEYSVSGSRIRWRALLCTNRASRATSRLSLVLPTPI
jgi:hypothetical protein